MSAELKLAGPTLKRHKSAQDLGTPWEFIRALEKKFGKLTWDLACTLENKKAPYGLHYPEYDAFENSWHDLTSIRQPVADYAGIDRKLLYLNPPFDPITPWVQKCAVEVQLGAEILLLAQASIDSNWFWNYVQPFATVYAIDRIKFEGEKHVYPKPLMLCHYCANPSPVLQRWRWKAEL